jgi:hypothetical protein
MKTYNLRILYPTSNNAGYADQSYTESIYATHVLYHETHLKFVDTESRCIIASYPSQFTIIESIEEE